MTAPLRILLLEDSATDAELIERFLRKKGLSFTARRVDREPEFRHALAAFRPQVILADYSLPHFDGLQALRLVRARDAELPFIFVTGALGEEAAVELLCNGANDYVLKDLLTRLPMALERALETARQRKSLRQTESSLRESEERFRAIVETTLDWIWEVDAEGRYTYVSPASFKLLGYTPEEMLGHRPDEFMPASETARSGASFAAILATQRTFSLLENRCLRKDGQRIETETSGVPILGAEGRFLGYRGIDRDITQRKRHVATLLLQAQRATALLELPRAAERLDEREFMQFGQNLAERLTESRIAFIHFVNDDQETIELVTWSRQTLDGYCQAAYDTHYPIGQAGVWADALRQRTSVVFNDYATIPHRHGLPDGHAALTRLISVPVLEGNLVRMMAGVGNKETFYTELDVESVQLIANEIWRIVRQRRADQSLRDSEERFRALFQNMRSGVCLYEAIDDGKDFLFRDVNRAVERIEGVTLAQLRGRRVTEMFPGVAAFGLLNVFERVWRSGIPESVPPSFYQDARMTGWRENFVYRLPHGELVAVYEDVTARKALEHALEDSRERLALALEGAETGMWDWQIQTGATQFNERWAEMLGYRLEMLQPVSIQTWIDLCHPDDLPLAQAKLERHFLGDAPYYECEFRMLNRDGHWVWILDRGKVVAWDADGKPMRMAGTHLDITARKNAEEERRKLLLAVEQSPASIVITDLEARIEYANPAFSRISGYSLDEAKAQNPRVLQSGLTPRAVYDDLWATLKRGDVWRGEFCNRRKDGSHYIELAVISPVRQQDGRVTHYLAVKENITERKRVEAELKLHRHHLEELVETRTAELKLLEERSRLILESSADGLYGEDTEGCATFINPAACAMLGYRPEAVLGCCMHDLIHHSYPDGTPYSRNDCPIHSRLKEDCSPRRDEDVFWHVDGHAFPVSCSSHPMYRDGQLIGAVISFFDISTQKQAAAAREAALAEAERLARLKSEFLANMSHEIRTPLNAVLGFAQIGVRQSDGRKSSDFFRRILDSGQLLLGIVNDILDFSKIEAGKLNIEQNRVDLRELIEHAAEQLRERARDKNLELRVVTSPALPATCRCDGLRLAQVLGNLLSNAIKFTAQGVIVLEVTRDAQCLLLRVADTGIGMTEAQLAALFRPFEQADGSITRRFGGTGLGLAISKRLLDMMDGEIRVQSRLGAGTRFEVRIPLIEPLGTLDRHPASRAAKAPAIPNQRLRGLVMLVAEDNPVNRMVLEELLQDEGCWLVQVENGLQAVERVTQDGADAFDLVLMDIQMPVMDGFEATRLLHAQAPALPIVGLTAHALRSERDQCLASGMIDHVAKPVDLDTLVQTILKYAQVRHADIPASPASDAVPPASAETPPGASAPEDTAIDWAALSARYRHRPEFLTRLLESVLAENATHAGALRQAANDGNLPRLTFLAHRLKGTAGNLFAERFRTLAANTENQAREAHPDASPLALRLANALERLLQEIMRRLELAATAEVSGTLSPLDATVLPVVIARLESLLALDDTETHAVFEEYRDLLLQTFGEPARQLGQQIRRFDYQTALDTLRTIKA